MSFTGRLKSNTSASVKLPAWIRRIPRRRERRKPLFLRGAIWRSRPNTDAIAILAHLPSIEPCGCRRLAAVPIDDPILSAGRLHLTAGAHRQLSSAMRAFERIFRFVAEQSPAIGEGFATG